MRLVSFAALAATAAVLTACGGDRDSAGKTQEPAVRIQNAWCRQTPNGAKTGACYATITAASSDRLMSVATPAAAATQIHEMVMEDGMGRMREIEDGLALPAGQAVAMSGTRHLMLLGLTQPMTAGTAVPLTFGFENSEPVTVNAQVLTAPPR